MAEMGVVMGAIFSRSAKSERRFWCAVWNVIARDEQSKIRNSPTRYPSQPPDSIAKLHNRRAFPGINALNPPDQFSADTSDAAVGALVLDFNAVTQHAMQLPVLTDERDNVVMQDFAEGILLGFDGDCRVYPTDGRAKPTNQKNVAE